MKLFVLTLTLLVSSALFAADRSAAYTAVCKNLYNDSAKTSCVAQIKAYNYFDTEALTICSKLFNDTSKVACLGLVADKTYEAYEIETCNSLYNDTAKSDCLKTNGSAYNPKPACTTREQVVGELNSAIIDLHAGNFSSVENRINGLLTTFINCK
jgi:hypothetical protein